jgi:hypothetical protein
VVLGCLVARMVLVEYPPAALEYPMLRQVLRAVPGFAPADTVCEGQVLAMVLVAVVLVAVSVFLALVGVALAVIVARADQRERRFGHRPFPVENNRDREDD